MPVAVIFDLFGTLLNITSLQLAAARCTSDAAAFVMSWREKQLAYSWVASLMNRFEDFDSITERSLRYTAARYGLTPDDGAWESLADEWRRLAPFAEVAAALKRLGELGVPRAVLTNGTAATAQAALQSAGLTDDIDIVLSVDAVPSYKPDPRVYALATAHFATTPDRLIFVTSNGWDAAGAAAFGLRVAWCNRAGAPAETLGDPPEWTIPDLRALDTTLGLVTSGDRLLE